jgi:ribosomal small subunit protein bTHX
MGKGDKKTKRGKIRRKSYGKSRPKSKNKNSNPVVLALRKIRSLKLSKYPENQIKQAITELGKVGIVIMTLHQGKSIMRLRPNKTEQETFSQKSELSYKPQRFNTTYQRASSPNNTMFYGCVVPEKIGNGEIENARITAVLEASSSYRNNVKKGIEKLTFSRWIVTRDIPLIAVVHHKDFVKKTGHATELSDAYDAFIKKHPEHRENSKLVTEYFAKEFSKKDIHADYDHMISALFAERVVEKGLAGVYFPSVRADAKGFNVAISPDYVNNCMELVYAGECTLYKNEKQIFVDNDTQAILNNGQTNFTFDEIIDPNIRLGKDASMKKVNLKKEKIK